MTTGFVIACALVAAVIIVAVIGVLWAYKRGQENQRLDTAEGALQDAQDKQKIHHRYDTDDEYRRHIDSMFTRRDP